MPRLKLELPRRVATKKPLKVGGRSMFDLIGNVSELTRYGNRFMMFKNVIQDAKSLSLPSKTWPAKGKPTFRNLVDISVLDDNQLLHSGFRLARIKKSKASAQKRSRPGGRP